MANVEMMGRLATGVAALAVETGAAAKHTTTLANRATGMFIKEALTLAPQLDAIHVGLGADVLSGVAGVVTSETPQAARNAFQGMLNTTGKAREIIAHTAPAGADVSAASTGLQRIEILGGRVSERTQHATSLEVAGARYDAIAVSTDVKAQMTGLGQGAAKLDAEIGLMRRDLGALVLENKTLDNLFPAGSNSAADDGVAELLAQLTKELSVAVEHGGGTASPTDMRLKLAFAEAGFDKDAVRAEVAEFKTGLDWIMKKA